MQTKANIAIATVALAGLILLVATNYGRPKDEAAFPVQTDLCDYVRETSLDECAIAFEDSYYKGGFSGKDMDWRRIRDDDRCQKLGTNVYYACIKYSKGGQRF
jgi:hypothetical protein